MNNIKKRLITGSAIFVVFVGIILLTLKVHWAFFDVFTVLLALLASVEMCGAISKRFPKPFVIIVALTVVIGYAAFIIAQTQIKIGGITSFYCVMLIMCLVSIIVSLANKKYNTNNVVATMFVLIYPVSLLMYLLGFNHLPEATCYRANAILLLFCVAPLTDTFAFLVGSVVKGKKLCPKISPNKTISGAIGGLIGGTLGGVILYFVSQTAVGGFLGMGNFGNLSSLMTCIHFICMGILCSIATQLGDLFASFIKRMVGIKDYSNLLPGHGGVMDRIDGLIFGCIVIYLYVAILMLV